MNQLVSLLHNPIFLVFGFLMFCVFMDTVASIARGGRARSARAGRRDHRNRDEARELQELHRGFEDLSARLESLETILLERTGKGERRCYR